MGIGNFLAGASSFNRPILAALLGSGGVLLPLVGIAPDGAFPAALHCSTLGGLLSRLFNDSCSAERLKKYYKYKCETCKTIHTSCLQSFLYQDVGF